MALDTTSAWRWPFRTRGTLALGLLLAGLGAALFVTTGGAAPRRASTDPLTGKTLVGFHIAGVPVNNPDKPPSEEQKAGGLLGYAIHLGGFQKELAKSGFEYLGLRGFPRTAACMLALTSGQVEVASTGDSPAVLSRSRGDEHHAIYITPPSTETWIVARKGGPSSLQDLAGKKVGTLLGSTFDYYFRAAAAQVGVQDVQFAQLQASAALPALQNDALDAYLTTSTTAALWNRKYGLPVIAKLSDVNPKLRGIGITTARNDFLKAHPSFPAAYFRGIKTAIDAIRRDKEAYLAWEAEATGIPLDILKASDSLRLADTPAPPESVTALEQQLDFRLKTGVANAPFDVREWVIHPEAANP